MHTLYRLFAAAMCYVLSIPLSAQRSETLLETGWLFHLGEAQGAEATNFQPKDWKQVEVPHDWAITGPFSRQNDLQNVAVSQNFEKQASLKTGRTGGLPYVGIGWYRRTFRTTPGKRITLVFDGAMSEAQVYINGQKAIFWPYGYNSFHCDVTDLVHPDGAENLLAVRLENRPESSRWYPGAGIYRHVHLVETAPIHVPVWGTQLTTPHVETGFASVTLRTTVENADTCLLHVVTSIEDADGRVVDSRDTETRVHHGLPVTQHFTVNAPRLWSPESPVLYRAVTKIYAQGQLQDTYVTPFGIRSIEYVADKGFFLNGQHRKFQGVCLHHDLGPLGAAVNESAIRHQLRLLKEMGCDAIRTTHNMPAPELVRLCDEMGFMLMIEAFDEWDVAKCENGYHRYFKDWAERDMVNMVRHFRNSPSVVMWSVGNEVPSQCSANGWKTARFLRDICHREDPTRPVTCGMDQASCVMDNGFASEFDIPGFNYRTHRYTEAYRRLPQALMLGTETASTVSSRGVYHFPVKKQANALTDDHQCSSYDLEYCSWSNIPDEDFALADDYPWTLGQFVWTGFDYLGEPSPYDTNAWPNHSSMFGIIDLASIPKDRYFLYQSQWLRDGSDVLHTLPHWTWPGREGKVTPVFVYTTFPSAELFVNGKSQGRRSFKSKTEATDNTQRYRLMWDSVRYEPGQIQVIAYDSLGQQAMQQTIATAGKPHHIEIWGRDGEGLSADGRDLYYLTVTVTDKDGNLCPHYNGLLHFRVKGCGKFKAVANGDPTCLESFQAPQMHAFGGKLTVIVQASTQPGTVTLEVTGKGLRKGSATVAVSEKTENNNELAQ